MGRSQKLFCFAVVVVLGTCGGANAQQAPFGGLTEEQIQQAEKARGMDRHEILRIQQQFPFPKQFLPADKTASADLAKRTAEVLEDELPDFSSSRIRNIKAVLMQEWNSFQRTYYICGQINAKNRFGAYSGWRSFYAQKEKDGRVAAYFEDGMVWAVGGSRICDKSSGLRTLEDRGTNYMNLVKPSR